MSKAPLSGIRVLDMSRILAGPWASQALADLGAEVIKIEHPRDGDDTRHWGPPYLRAADGSETDTATYFLAANRGKASMTVDLATPGGQKIIHDLASVSDVLIENFKVGGLAKFGLDYASLSEQCPRLVYCSITGFGQDGPLCDRPGYDLLIQAMGGLMSITGPADGPPLKAGVAIADICAGLYATIAIQGALLERARSGLGQHIDIGLLDVQAAMLANQATNYLAGGLIPGRLGNAHPNIAPYQVFEAADGYLVLAVGNDSQFRRFAELAGDPELASDPRFKSNASRVRNRTELCERIAALLKSRSRAHWLEVLEGASIPSGPINNIAEVFDNSQIIHRKMRMALEHAEGGQVELVASPINFSRSPAGSQVPPPALGQHTAGILEQLLGYTQAEIAALREQGAI